MLAFDLMLVFVLIVLCENSGLAKDRKLDGYDA
jgi:hypothetical protein